MPLVAISVTGTNVEPHPDRGEHDPGQEVGDVGAVRREPQEEQQPDDRDRHPDQRHLARAEPRDELLGEAGADDDPGREREEREAGLERRVAEHALE